MGRTLAAIVLGVLVVAGCSRDVTRAERRVCSELQQMIDALAEERSLEAVVHYDAMVATANAEPTDTHGDASPIVAEAQRMSEVTDARVDESKLTMSEVPDLAREAMTQSGDALGRLVVGCEEAGLPVDGLTAAGAQ